VFDLIARQRMDVPHRRAGWMQGAHTEAGLNEVSSRAEQWARQGADVAVLDRAETAEHLGCNAYLGGWVDRRGGAVQPLAHACGMARAAGAALHGQSPVSAMHRQSGKWHVQTVRPGGEWWPSGCWSAPTAILARSSRRWRGPWWR